MQSADVFRIKMVLGLFTVDKGEIKVLLFKKAGNPYKGYWSLPSKLLTYEENFEENTQVLLKEKVGLSNVYTETFQAFEDKEEYLDNKMVHITRIAVTDIATAMYKRNEVKELESNWFSIRYLPKLCYNHAEIIHTMLQYLQKRFKDIDMLKRLFPSDFTLPELQSFCEIIEGEKLDRRNFRKKVLSSKAIEDTGDQNENHFGRPAKLYRFKENLSENSFF